MAQDAARENLKKFADRITFFNKNFDNLGLIIRKWDVQKVDGILFDLGTSNYQLESKDRGFSFREDSKLDMRMSPESQRLSAFEIVNTFDEKNLSKILKTFGEEPFAGKIAKNIVLQRRKKEIYSTNELVQIIKDIMPPSYRHSKEKHFATSTFRALRMAVNKELEVLENGLKQAVQILSPGGRLVVISFHSLEDRIVKNFFKENSNLEILTNKPIQASEAEILENPKSRSAKLRAAIKI